MAAERTSTTADACDVPASRTWQAGPIFAVVNLAIAVTCSSVMLAVEGITFHSLIDVLFMVVKVSTLLFILAFICRPLHELVKSKLTARLLANRRYIGLSFAAWHLIHLPVLGLFLWVLGPTNFYWKFKTVLYPAGGTLLVIALLAATSSNRAVRFLGKPLWSAIHTVGIYMIWAWFWRTLLYDFPHPKRTYVYGYFALLTAALVFRWTMAGVRGVHHLRAWQSRRAP